MKRRLMFLFLFLLTAHAYPARACLNDRDTAAEEAAGLPDLMAVVTGRFERNPPLYYEMRIQRVVRELAQQPGNLDAYDDIAVACDRLGRDDEALAWMARKRERLPALSQGEPAVQEAWYRYYANDGTSRIHRWIRSGAKPGQLSDAREARDEIAKALKIKPDAHFGREKYQYRVMTWLIDLKSRSYVALTRHKAGSDTALGGVELGSGPVLADVVRGNDSRRDIVKGLCGLIVLGNAWESPDIFCALGRNLDRYREHHLCYFTLLRAQELQRGGHTFMEDDPEYARLGYDLRGGEKPADQKIYRDLRAESESWQAARTAYMMPRLLAGRHPDTDPAFWNDYHPAPPPQLRDSWTVGFHRFLRRALWLYFSFALITLPLTIWAFCALVGRLGKFISNCEQRRVERRAKLRKKLAE